MKETMQGDVVRDGRLPSMTVSPAEWRKCRYTVEPLLVERRCGDRRVVSEGRSGTDRVDGAGVDPAGLYGFFATAVHELRNSVAPLRYGAASLRLQNTQEASVPVLDAMDRHITRLAELIGDLLDVARGRTGKLVPRRERVSMQTIVDAAIEASRGAFDGSGQHLVLDYPGQPVHVSVDPLRIAQALINLLGNACKFTPRGGKVAVAIAADAGHVAVRVADDGVGIPGHMLSSIFEMYTQAPSAVDDAHGGLGIGLALARTMVEAHGGTVHAESEGPGRGSVFTMRLPRVD